MKLFIWNRADGATERYHDKGGVVAIADNLERARVLISQLTGTNGCTALTEAPDVERNCDGPEYVVVHPDAGCC
jgi:hypothetical protein